jgi:Asp-tRNA(Asn)/Glu-tRNA(Gln) amidotransferase A subunit family amidase
MSIRIDTLAKMPLTELQRAYADRALSPVEVAEVTFAQIAAVEGQINAFYDLQQQQALTEAAASERRYARGTQISAFDGVPVSLKDSVNAVGLRWFHGSAIHGEGRVAQKDAPPTARLKQAGAIVIGKCIMPDFGLSASGVSSSHQIVRNPWGLGWNTGGSSAGAGASLACGIAMMSVGSDIAGSVRLPASHCGLAAFKPTQGVIPHAPASTVRSAGPMTRRAADLHAWTKLLSGPDDADRYSMPYCEDLPQHPLKVGASCDFGFGPALDPAVRGCFDTTREALCDLLGEVADIDQTAGFDAYLPIDDSLKLRGWAEYAGVSDAMRARAPKALYDWFREAETWGPEKLRAIEAGIEQGVAFCVDLLAKVDILMTPVMPIVNFPADDLGIDPNMPLRHTTFTALFNQSGHPAVTLCGGFDARGLPIGIQLVGKRLQDTSLLDLAVRLEQKLDVFTKANRRWPTVPIA